MKVRKKPIVVEAEQFVIGQKLPFTSDVCWRNADESCSVQTLNGPIELLPGDWVIKGNATDDYYPCNPNIFESLFEKVE